MDNFVEPNWRSSKAQLRRIGLPNGHTLMRRFHEPDDEKRMIVILPPERYSDWLHASAAQSIDVMQPWPADRLLALDPVVEERGLF